MDAKKSAGLHNCGSDLKTDSSTAVSSRSEEYQYLDLINLILNKGISRPDRTGTGTISFFAPPQLRFSLRNESFPLLTTKKVFLRGMIQKIKNINE